MGRLLGSGGPGPLNLVFFIEASHHESHVVQGVWMFVYLRKVQEEGARGGKDDFVSLNLLTIFTGQGDMSELLVLPQCS